jgi:hypothetical protein
MMQNTAKRLCCSWGDTVLKRSLYIIITFLVIFAQTVWSQTYSQPVDYSKIALNIKFFDRTIYYAGNSPDNPLNIHVSIVNTGTETFRFKLADDRMFSVDFTAYTIKNTKIAQTDLVLRKRSTNQTVYFREITIEPGEEYSFVENAKDYLSFADPSIYYLELTFYPELYKSKTITVTSNRLSVEMRPSPSALSSSELPVQSKTVTLLRPEEISPDKVVEQTIVARQKSLWDQYFLYMDIEQMMIRDSAAKRRYTAASADERQRMISNYKSDLIQNRIDFDIVAIPEKYLIESTTYSQIDGTVSVIEWFKYPTYREKKRYVYFVRQRDAVWQIYDYTVTNLGTE